MAVDFETLAKMDALLGDNTVSSIAAIFGHMEIAEEEIAAAIEAYPDRADEIDAVFRCCQWPEVLPSEAAEILYRYHIRQLIQFILDDETLSQPTGVEVMRLVCGASEIAPMRSEVYWWMLTRPLMDEMAEELWGEGLPPIGPVQEWESDDIKDQMFRAWAKVAKVGLQRQKQYEEALERRRRRAEVAQVELEMEV